MKSLTSFLKRFGLPFVAILGFFLLFKIANAAGNVDVGIAAGNSLKLGSANPYEMVIKIINFALGFLGLISVLIIIYAGFLWMTSGGNQDRVAEAKKWLKNGIIGLLIIVSAWGIVLFIFKTILGVNNGNNGGDNNPYNPPNNNNLSLGAAGSCSIESFYPQDGKKEVARNTSILVTFKEKVQADSVCVSKTNKQACSCNQGDCSMINPQNIEIYKTAEGNSCSNNSCPAQNDNLTNASASLSTDGKTIIIKPLEYLGSSSGNVEYAVRLTSGLKKDGGESLFKTCSADYFEWKFETSSKLDLESPQVLMDGVFPPFDSEQDSSSVIGLAETAKAQIKVNSCPKVYAPAKLVSVRPVGSSVPATLQINSSYSGTISDFVLDVVPNKDKMRLYSGSNLLGTADIKENKADFSEYFSVTIDPNFAAGNSWQVDVSPSQAADNLKVASITYVFVGKKEDAGNGIVVPASCDASAMALNMELALSGHPDISVSRSGGTLTLSSKIAGVSGNSLALSSNSQGLSLTPFSGGKEKTSTYGIKGKKDKPMNTVIQINFNEAVNPSTLIGTSDELKNYVRVANANGSALMAGAVCSVSADCLSYDCEAGHCIGNYVSGKFSLSSDYDTVEFVSNKECGVNSCGETIYCLPANSHLAIRINAATLKQCSSSDNCSPFAPFSECLNGGSGKVCRDAAKNSNYPLADTLRLDGITDLAFNSLDGNRDNKADGPVQTVYPYFSEGDPNLNKRDGYELSFYIGDQIKLDPPTISVLNPVSFANNIGVKDPVVIDFNDLMMNNSLRTGGVQTNSGGTVIEHKLINLRNSANKPLGYWLNIENKEVGVPDNEPDATKVIINHSDFFESITYLSQVGSGVKNIYQNCFKPSSGPGCAANSNNPSCCFGSATNALDKDGNCSPLK